MRRERLAAAHAGRFTGVDMAHPRAPREWLAPGEPIISIRGVTKSFGSHTVLRDITFDVPKGKITAILGPSGTGKSVLLKNILGLLKPDRGTIWVDGDQIVGLRERRLYEVRRKFGVLFQDGALFGSMSLYDNIAFPLREHTHKNEREIREIVLNNAGLVGLLDHLKKLPGEVSGGMKKRAGLARAMVTEPDIILFDEPDSGLDPVRVAYLDDLIRNVQHETGATFFVITHNISSVMRMADYLGLLFRSYLVKFATKEEMAASEDPIVCQFMAGESTGPIGMDEMADSDDTPAATFRPGNGSFPAAGPPTAPVAPRPLEAAVVAGSQVHQPTAQPTPAVPPPPPSPAPPSAHPAVPPSGSPAPPSAPPAVPPSGSPAPPAVPTPTAPRARPSPDARDGQQPSDPSWREVAEAAFNKWRRRRTERGQG